MESFFYQFLICVVDFHFLFFVRDLFLPKGVTCRFLCFPHHQMSRMIALPSSWQSCIFTPNCIAGGRTYKNLLNSFDGPLEIVMKTICLKKGRNQNLLYCFVCKKKFAFVGVICAGKTDGRPSCIVQDVTLYLRLKTSDMKVLKNELEFLYKISKTGLSWFHLIF